jgi:hypothetical protein
MGRFDDLAGNTVLPNGDTDDAEPTPDPWLLNELDEFIGRFVAFPSDDARYAVTLWVAHCHAFDAFESTPRLTVVSPEKGSGKTRVLEVIGMLVPTPIHAVNMSAAALYRVIVNKPTLLLDEADTYLGAAVAKQHEDIRGLINAGHRRGATVYRAEVSGKAVKVVEFPAFAPCALAGIGDLPDTILDRSILIAMRRRSPNEHVEPFRERLVRPAAGNLLARLARWGIANWEDLADAWPEMPDGLVDRAADVWEPLLAIADAVGDPWPQRARQAAVNLNAARQQRDPSLGVQLLGDCRRIFTDRDVDRLSTEALIEALTALDESPWGDLRGKPIDARGVARRLRKYEVRPGDHRFADGTKKGYLAEDFHDAWQRYLPTPSAAVVADVALVALPRTPRERTGVLPLSEDEVGYDLSSIYQGVSLSTAGDGQQGQQGQHPSASESLP